MSDFADFAPPRDLRKDGTMMVSYGTDDGMIVEFFEEPLYMEYLSKSLGHPIYRMNIMTRIMQPGNRNTVWVHQTKGITYEMVVDPQSGEYHTDWDILEVCDNGDVPEPTKYPKAWARFMKKGISADTGHPIEQWGIITRSYAESLKAQNIHTVEALAGLTDQAAQTIMGAVKYRDQAKAYLDEREKNRIVAREQEKASRFEELYKESTARIEALNATVMALQARMTGADAPSPDRPPHTAAEALGQMKQLSVEQSRKKHKIPDADKAA
jgi:hypothetical protein